MVSGKRKDRKALVWRMKVMASNMIQGHKLPPRRQLLNKLLYGASPWNPTYVLGRILSNFKSQGASELTVYKDEEVFILFEVNDWAFVTIFNNVCRKGYVPLDFCDVVKDFYDHDTLEENHKKKASANSKQGTSQPRKPPSYNQWKNTNIPQSNTAPNLSQYQHKHLHESRSMDDIKRQAPTQTQTSSSTPTAQLHHHTPCCCCHHIHHLKIEERHMNILEYLSRTHAVRPDDCESGLGDSESVHSADLITSSSNPHREDNSYNSYPTGTGSSNSELLRESTPKTELSAHTGGLSSGPSSTGCSSHGSSDELKLEDLKLECSSEKWTPPHHYDDCNSRNSSLCDSAFESIKLSPTQSLNQSFDMLSPGAHNPVKSNDYTEPHNADFINVRFRSREDSSKKLPRTLPNSCNSSTQNVKSKKTNPLSGLLKARQVDLSQMSYHQDEPARQTNQPRAQPAKARMLSELSDRPYASSTADSLSEDESCPRPSSRTGVSIDQSSTDSRELLERSRPESVCDLDDEGTTCWELDDSDCPESDEGTSQYQRNKVTQFSLPPKRSSVSMLRTKPTTSNRVELSRLSERIEENLNSNTRETTERRGFMRAMCIDTVSEEDEFSGSDYPESESHCVDEAETSDQPPSETETESEAESEIAQSENESVASEMSIVVRHNARQQTLKSIQEQYKRLEEARKLCNALKEIKEQIKTSN